MTPELKYLSYTAVITTLMWVPYILNVIARNRLSDAVGYPAEPLAMAPWAERLKKAHYNAVENLVVFAALVLVMRRWARRRSRPILRWDRCDRTARSGATCSPTGCSASRGHASRADPVKSGRLNAANNGRSAATKPSTSARCGTAISTTAG